MAQVLMGKLLPNLKITLGNDATADENIEEGEIVESGEASENNEGNNEESSQNVEIIRTWMKTMQSPKVYENRNGAFITGLDLNSEVVIHKLEERAARFGLERKEEFEITPQAIAALYSSMGIDSTNLNSCKKQNIRLDAIHMRGVDEMSTNEIFQYFRDYGPSSVEWINDFSCNVVWLDETSAARALLGLSRSLVVRRKKDDASTSLTSDSTDLNNKKDLENIEEEAVILMSDSDENEVDEKDETNDTMEVDLQSKETSLGESTKESSLIDVPVPPGLWRLGIPHPKAKAILLRFATKDDKKLPGAEKRSQYYQKYGNPNYGGMRGLISGSRKRKMQAARNRLMIGKLTDDNLHPTFSVDTDLSAIQTKPFSQRSRVKQPRMRMYADDEEDKKNQSRLGKFSSKQQSIYSRLGVKYTKSELYHLGSKFSDSEDESDKPVSLPKVTSRFNIWTDLARSMAEEENYSLPRNDSRTNRLSKNHLRTNRPSREYLMTNRPSKDLRSTLNSSHQSKTNKLSSNINEGDLRSKIKKMRKDDSVTKHRSPMFKNESDSESD